MNIKAVWHGEGFYVNAQETDTIKEISENIGETAKYQGWKRCSDTTEGRYDYFKMFLMRSFRAMS